MIADQQESDRSGLERWLSSTWNEPVAVSVVHYSTAGARRRNLIFDVLNSKHTGRYVATILPTSDISLMSMEDEAAVRTLARASGVRAPAIVGVCSDEEWLGSDFFVSDFVDGETIPRRVLRLVDEHGTGSLVVAQIGDALARLHAIDSSLAPVALRPAGDVVRSAMAGVKDAMDAMIRPEPAFAYAFRWLRENLPPEPERRSVVHADVRTGNVIVDDAGLQSILDWETSKIGDPMEDLAWTCTRMWRFGRDEFEVGGLGTIDTLRSAYVDAGGRWDEERFTWWRVLTSLRWGTGLAGQAAAHLDGTFSSIVMAASGRRVSEIAFDILTLTAPNGERGTFRTHTEHAVCSQPTRGK